MCKGCGGVMRVAPIGLACDDPFTLGSADLDGGRDSPESFDPDNHWCQFGCWTCGTKAISTSATLAVG